MFSKTFAAIATAAVLAVGTLATAAPAAAGYHHGHGGIVVKFGHGYGHGYDHGYGYAPVYQPSCFVKHVQVWTHYGPEWVAKTVCH